MDAVPHSAMGQTMFLAYSTDRVGRSLALTTTILSPMWYHTPLEVRGKDG